MRTVHDIHTLTPDRPVVLTIGKFDGVHLGHQHLISQVISRARQMDAQAGVITLHPHPREVLFPGETVQYLTTLGERLSLIEQQGVDLAIVLPFTPDLARTPARDFVLLLTTHLRLRALVVGPDFALGRGREGDIPFLRQIGQELGFEVHVVDPLTIEGRVIRSAEIRTLLAEGKVRAAFRLLGRWPNVIGQVVRGAGRGHKLGFPTANIEVPSRRIIPANGVYAVRVRLYDEKPTHPELGEAEGWHNGVANVGVRPSFGESERTVEVHLFDFAQEVYGKWVDVQFIERLRDERRFEHIEELIHQIHADVATARAILEGMTMPVPFEELEHTADVALKVYGRDLAELFVNAARGMLHLMLGSEPSSPPQVKHEITLEDIDTETLLVDWLSQLLYYQETEGVLFTDFSVEEITETTLKATVAGTNSLKPKKMIKAVTFHNLEVKRTPQGYEAVVVFDV